jgi:hypothetical protein
MELAPIKIRSAQTLRKPRSRLEPASPDQAESLLPSSPSI